MTKTEAQTLKATLKASPYIDPKGIKIRRLTHVVGEEYYIIEFVEGGCWYRFHSIEQAAFAGFPVE